MNGKRGFGSIATSTIFAACVVGAPLAAHAASYLDMRRVEPLQGDANAGAAKVVACAACHGPNGNAVVPMFPRLAGQRAEYLYSRLVEFKHADAKLPYYTTSPMPAQAAALTDADMRNIAAYFAAQTPTAVASTAAAPSTKSGAALYHGGDPSRGVPPCQGCHGVDAEGGPVASGSQYLSYPILRGQHAQYLLKRLNDYHYGWPYYTSGDFIMHGVASTLDNDSMQSLALWLESLPAAPVK